MLQAFGVLVATELYYPAAASLVCLLYMSIFLVSVCYAVNRIFNLRQLLFLKVCGP